MGAGPPHRKVKRCREAMRFKHGSNTDVCRCQLPTGHKGLDHVCQHGFSFFVGIVRGEKDDPPSCGVERDAPLTPARCEHGYLVGSTNCQWCKAKYRTATAQAPDDRRAQLRLEQPRSAIVVGHLDRLKKTPRWNTRFGVATRTMLSRMRESIRTGECHRALDSFCDEFDMSVGRRACFTVGQLPLKLPRAIKNAGPCEKLRAIDFCRAPMITTRDTVTW